MIEIMPPSRKQYYTVLLDRPEARSILRKKAYAVDRLSDHLILVFNKTVKNRFIRLLFQQPAA